MIEWLALGALAALFIYGIIEIVYGDGYQWDGDCDFDLSEDDSTDDD